MTEKKLFEMLEKLERKTSANELKWEATANETSFQTQLSYYIIKIKQLIDQEKIHLLEIIDKDGTTLESIDSDELHRRLDLEGDLEAESVRQLMETLFIKARRNALGVEKALDNILNEL
jgi:hypothetical protein